MEVSFKFSVRNFAEQNSSFFFALINRIDLFYVCLISPWGDGTVGWRKREAEVEEAG